MKRWLAGMLVVILLFSGGLASLAEESPGSGKSKADIEESMVTREGEELGSLADNIRFFLEYAAREDIRSLFDLDDVKDIFSEVFIKVGLWLLQNRPVALKILKEFGIPEMEVTLVSELWDSADRITVAQRNFSETEAGSRLVQDVENLMQDNDFKDSVKNFGNLLNSDDFGNFLSALQKLVQEGKSEAKQHEGPLTAEAFRRQLDRSSFAGEIIFLLFYTAEQSEWGKESVPKLLKNEKLWKVAQAISNAGKDRESLVTVICEEIQRLFSLPEMTHFLENTVPAIAETIAEFVSSREKEPSADKENPGVTENTENTEKNENAAKEADVP